MSSDKKYFPRTMPVITRESYNVEKSPTLPSWMDEFSKNLQKVSVEPMRHEQSVYDQISSIMGNKSKYPTVEAAVEDMKERSGLSAYLKNSQVDNQSISNKKKANSNEVAQVNLFEKVPQIKSTVDNYCEDTRGNLPIPAIIEKIKSIHKNDVSDDADWDDPAFFRYLNKKNIEVKKNNPNNDSNYSNLGRNNNYNDDSNLDPSNTDALHALTPAVVSK